MPKKTTVAAGTNEDGTPVISGTAEDLIEKFNEISEKRKDEAKPKEDQKPIVIKGAALKDIFCHYSYDHTVAPNVVNSVNIKSAVPIHDDMKMKFKFLRNHLAAICEELTDDQMENFKAGHFHQDMAEWFSVYAFRIQGTGDNEGAVLIGEKTLSTGDTVKLETPLIKWDSDKYHLPYELRMAIDDCVHEVELYMQGKQAPAYVQTGLFDENEAV